MAFMMSSEPRIQAVDAMSETSREETVGRNYFWLDCDARGPPSFGKKTYRWEVCCIAHLVSKWSRSRFSRGGIKKGLGQLIVFFLLKSNMSGKSSSSASLTYYILWVCHPETHRHGSQPHVMSQSETVTSGWKPHPQQSLSSYSTKTEDPTRRRF